MGTIQLFSKNRMHRVLELELEQTNNDRTGSPSNTKSPGLRPTSIPSGISMLPAVWPQ